IGDDGFGVPGTIALDVVHGVVNVVDDTNGQDGGEVFSFPVFLRGRCGVGHQRLRAFAAAQTDAFFSECLGQTRQQGRGNVVMHQQCFHGAANAVAIGFGVNSDVVCHVEIGVTVDVQVAVAVQVFDQGYLGIGTQAGDQALAATRNDDIDVIGHGDQFAHGGAVGGVDHLYGVGRQAGIGQSGLNDGTQRLIRVKGLAAAAQNSRVA